MAATHTFLPVALKPIQHESEIKTHNKLGCFKDISKPAPIKGLRFKTNVRRPTQIKSTVTKTRGDEVSSPSSSSTSYLKQLPELSMFFSPIRTIFEATKPTQFKDDQFSTNSGRFVDNGVIDNWIVVIDNWIVPSGKNCMRRDSVIRDSKTGQTLIRASSNWVIMNKETRRLSRIPEEVRAEMSPYLMDATPIIEDDTNKLPKLDEDTSDFVVSGLKPRWSDLDTNQHVNNAKYIGWVLESAPPSILENHEISRVTMEYRRECHRDSELESLTTVGGGVDCDFFDRGNVDCNYMLRLKGGAEVMKARTLWRPRNVCTPASLLI